MANAFSWVFVYVWKGLYENKEIVAKPVSLCMRIFVSHSNGLSCYMATSTILVVLLNNHVLIGCQPRLLLSQQNYCDVPSFVPRLHS